MIGKLFKSKNQEKNGFLTIDIGSQTVKCLAFQRIIDESDNTHSVKVVGIGKEWLEPWSVRSGHIIEIDKVTKALDAAIYKATENLEVDIDDVIFGVSGDACTCLVTTARALRDKPEKEIKGKELDKLEAKVANAAFTKIQERHAKKTGDPNGNMDLITTSIVYNKIDGETVTHLEGATGRDIEIALFTAFTPNYYLKTLEEIASMLNLNILAVTSNLYALSESLKRSKNNFELDGVLMDIGSDTTDIGVMFGGGIVTSESLDIGGSQFTKHVSASNGISYGEAEKLKYDYTYNKLADEEKEEVESSLVEATTLWLSGLEVLFTNFEGIKTFSPVLYVTGGGSKLPLINDFLENKPWTKSIPFKELPNFVTLTADDISHVLDTTGEADKEEYIVPLALSVIYLEVNHD